MPRDGSPRAAARRPCSAPEVGEPRRIQAFAGLGWTPKRLGCLADVVLKKPGLS